MEIAQLDRKQPITLTRMIKGDLEGGFVPGVGCRPWWEMGCGKERQCAVEDSYYHNVLGRGNEIFWGKKFIVHVLNSSEISLKDSVPSGFSCSMYFSLLWD